MSKTKNKRKVRDHRAEAQARLDRWHRNFAKFHDPCALGARLAFMSIRRV